MLEITTKVPLSPAAAVWIACAIPTSESTAAAIPLFEDMLFSFDLLEMRSCDDLIVGEESIERSEAPFRLLELQEMAGIGDEGIIDAECLAK